MDRESRDRLERSKAEIFVVFGTRPEAIKMAPVISELQKQESVKTGIISSGQHDELLEQMLENFSISPDKNLQLMENDQSLTDLTGRALSRLSELFRREKPDLIMVHGDTTTTFSAALAAYYNQIPVAHVEAGLRSHDRYSPFPEEMNRHLTDVLADIHFAPTLTNRENLLAENVSARNIYVTGNTVIDAVKRIASQDFSLPHHLQEIVADGEKEIILLTTHRRENMGEDMEEIFAAVREIAGGFEDVEVIFPLHLNPGVRKPALSLLGGVEGINLIEPLDYSTFINLLGRSRLILTDSGGIQEEAPALDIPVVLLRETTERPEALEAGTVLKAGTDKERIVEVTARLLREEDYYRSVARKENPYGDGRAAARVVKGVLNYLGLSPEGIEEFTP